MIYSLIKDRMYERNIVFIGNCTEEALSEWLKKNHDAEVEVSGAIGKTLWFNDENQNLIYVVWVEDVKRLEVVAHEVFHLVVRVLGDIGMNLSDESDEAYAWYLESIYKNILIFIKQRGVKHGRNSKSKRKRSSRSS